MKCSCFAISLFLIIISISQYEGSWLSAFTRWDAPAQPVREASSLEEMERIDPDLYQQVVETRPALLYLHKMLEQNPTLDDLRKIDPMVYRRVIRKYPRLAGNRSRSDALRRRMKFLKKVHPELYEQLQAQHPEVVKSRRGRELQPALGVLRRADPQLYQQLVSDRPDLADPTPATPTPAPTLNDLRHIDPHMYRQVVDELQTIDFEYPNPFNLTELRLRGNGTRFRRAGKEAYKAMYNTWGVMYKYNLGRSPNYQGSFVQQCYDCGNSQYPKPHIPKSPICHDAFESPDWRARTTARYYRSKCHYNSYNDMSSYGRRKPFYFDEKIFLDTRGHKLRVYGLKSGGCYKRFLDVGKIYTQRGCRRWPPGPWWSNDHTTGNFASHRYRKLEYLLGKEQTDRCLFSPHASLTPFHRGISLFARYHVCVCHTDYCNAAPAPAHRHWLSPAPLLVLLTFREFY